MSRISTNASKFTLQFLLLASLASAAVGNVHGEHVVKTNACANDCTWMAAQVAGCSGMDIHCACTTSVFQASFRQCVERSCSFTDAGEGVQFFENACAPHVSVGHDVLLEGSDYYGPDVVENVRHGHAYHGKHAHMHHARAEKGGNAIPTQPTAIATTAPAATSSEPAAAPINVGSSAPVSESSSAATTEPTTASESSSSPSSGHTTTSHTGASSSPTHAGTSSQAAGTDTSKPAPHPTNTNTTPTTPATTPATPTPTPTVDTTSQTDSNTEAASSSATAVAASGTTLVVGGSNVSIGSGATNTDVSINPSIVTPTLPSGHFDPAPSSGAAGAMKPGAGFATMAGVVLVAVLGGGAFVL
ncbi:hypothetical protein BC629DRAFT_1587559 [Irpex lacteus]|nr:hypothetical protein BC629DRAFT_1587559 [Irpex lacteus]